MKEPTIGCPQSYPGHERLCKNRNGNNYTAVRVIADKGDFLGPRNPEEHAEAPFSRGGGLVVMAERYIIHEL